MYVRRHAADDGWSDLAEVVSSAEYTVSDDHRRLSSCYTVLVRWRPQLTSYTPYSDVLPVWRHNKKLSYREGRDRGASATNHTGRRLLSCGYNYAGEMKQSGACYTDDDIVLVWSDPV